VKLSTLGLAMLLATVAGAAAGQGAPDRAGSTAPPPPVPGIPIVQPKAPARQRKPKAPPGLYLVERQGTGVRYFRGYVRGIGVHVIEADLSDPEVRIGAMLAEGGIGAEEGFDMMMARAQPAAAITGTFFGVGSNLPTGDLVINSRPVFRGFVGTAIAITGGNVVSFIATERGEPPLDWSLFETVIRGGPRLLKAGKIAMAPRNEGFGSLPVSQQGARTAVALTKDNRLRLVATRQLISLWEMAKVVKAIGAYHAAALDGGTSTALYFAGRHLISPGRGLTNALLVYHRRDQYERMRPSFSSAAVPGSVVPESR
jgi:hypothetical protein